MIMMMMMTVVVMVILESKNRIQTSWPGLNVQFSSVNPCCFCLSPFLCISPHLDRLTPVPELWDSRAVACSSCIQMRSSACEMRPLLPWNIQGVAWNDYRLVFTKNIHPNTHNKHSIFRHKLSNLEYNGTWLFRKLVCVVWSDPEGCVKNRPVPNHKKANTVCINPGIYYNSK